jgi:hypothetical protein
VIASSFLPTYGGGLFALERLTDRERERVVAAIDNGELVPIIDVQPQEHTSIVGVIAAEHVERFCAEPDDGARATMANRLAELRDELSTLSQIVREVMAEKSPGDFRDRIENCIDDARELLSRAENAAEEI